MANGSNERPPGGLPNTEEADRLAELLRPSWELEGGAAPAPAAPPDQQTALEQALAAQTPAVAAPPAAEAAPVQPPTAESPTALSSTPQPAHTAGSRRALKQTLLGLQPPPPPGQEAHAPISVRPPAPNTGESPPPPPPPPPPLGPPGESLVGGVPPRDQATMIGMGRPPTPELEAQAWPYQDFAAPARCAGNSPELANAPADAAPGAPVSPDLVSRAPDASSLPGEVSDASRSGSSGEAIEGAVGSSGATPDGGSEPQSQSFRLAKPYVPKDDPNTPAVVVDASVLTAGSSAAQAEAAERRARARRSATAQTIPGSMRALTVPVPRAAASVALDEAEVAALKPRRGKFLGMVIGLGAVAAAVFLLFGKGQPAPSASTTEPRTGPVAAPTAAGNSTATVESTVAAEGASPVPGMAAETPAANGAESEGPTDKSDVMNGTKPAAEDKEADASAAPRSKTEGTSTSARASAAKDATSKEAASTKEPAAKDSTNTAKKSAPVKRSPAPTTATKPKSVIIRDSPF